MTKIDQITSEALRRASEGVPPDAAWVQALEALYAPEKLANQVKHSCPKWAFSILCHEGHVVRVQPGTCPAAVGKRSAAFTLDAVEWVRRDPALVHDKRELKRRVFGEQGAPGYRKPNDEVEVLFSLLNSGGITVSEPSKNE
jgi:hypothetical protein